MATTRKRYLDLLRIIAIFLVIFNHLPGYKLYQASSGIKQFIYMAFTMITRVNVPIFFMISGALLLGKTETYSLVFKKRIPRFFAVICIFIAGLYLLSYFSSLINHTEYGFTLSSYFLSVLSGGGAGKYLAGIETYWFLYAYLSFLFVLPLLQRIANGMTSQDFKVLLAVHFFFSSLYPMVYVFMYIIDCPEFYFTYDFSVPLAEVKALFYPLIGYYLDQKVDITSMKLRTMVKLAFTAFAGILLSCLFTYYEGITSGTYTQNFVQLFDYLTAIAVFLWVKYIFTNTTNVLDHPKAAVITKISSLTFGMYLLDPYFKEMVYGIYNRIVDPYAPIIIISFGWCILSMVLGGCATAILKKMPMFRKIL